MISDQAVFSFLVMQGTVVAWCFPSICLQCVVGCIRGN